MSSDLQQIRIDFTDNHACSHLPHLQERVAVTLDEFMHTFADNYEVLLANGFRRSGSTIYKPHCDNCSACQAIRLSIPGNKSFQKANDEPLNKAKSFHWEFKDTMDDNWFDLYSRYITARHKSEPCIHQRKKNSYSSPKTSGLLHNTCISTMRTIFGWHRRYRCYVSLHQCVLYLLRPDIDISMGTLGVLFQIQHAQKEQKQWLYLGYQIEMNVLQ